MLPFLKISPIFFLAVTVIALPSSPALGEYRLEITPKLVLAQEYDDNIFLTHENTSSDYITTLSPGIKIKADSLKNKAELDYAATRVSYQNHSRSDTWRHRADLNLWHRSNEYLQFKLEDNYLKSEEPVEPERNNQGTSRSRNTYQRNKVQGRMDYQFGQEENLAAGYAYETLQNDDPAVTDAAAYGPFVKLNYWFNKKNGVEMGYQFLQYEFDTRNDLTSYDDHRTHKADLSYIHRFNPKLRADIHYGLTENDFRPASERDYRVHQGDMGIKYDFSAHTSLELRGGYYRSSFNNAETFLGAAILRKEMKHGRISLEFQRGWDEDYLDLETRGFTRYWDTRGGIQYTLRKDLEASLDISYRKNSYLFARQPDDEIYRGQCGLAWKFRRWYTVGLNYSYHDRRSADPQREYESNSIMLSFSIARPFYPKGLQN